MNTKNAEIICPGCEHGNQNGSLRIFKNGDIMCFRCGTRSETHSPLFPLHALPQVAMPEQQSLQVSEQSIYPAALNPHRILHKCYLSMGNISKALASYEFAPVPRHLKRLYFWFFRPSYDLQKNGSVKPNA